MTIAIIGESCTGKSTLANELSKMTDRKIYTGKDYLKLAKNEVEAKQIFTKMLQENNEIIYVISELEHLELLPENTLRVLVTADLDIIKNRFAQRMDGNLPTPVAAMLEAKHGMFDNISYQLKIGSDDHDVVEKCTQIINLIA